MYAMKPPKIRSENRGQKTIMSAQNDEEAPSSDKGGVSVYFQLGRGSTTIIARAVTALTLRVEISL
eukprot:scaffold7556_cov111-Cylindrotheca_fusiformis.AAC.4